MKKLIPFLFLLIVNFCNCQFLEEQYSKSKIYKLKQNLESGQKNALYILASYLDSHKKLAEFLGHHYLETEERTLAKRAIKENSTFTNQEIIIDSISSSKQFLDFLKENDGKIKYSSTLQAFYITPIDQRNEIIEFRELPKAKIEKLTKRIPEIFQQDWVKNAGLDVLIKQNKPESLKKICEEFYRRRDKFNNHNSKEDEFYDVLSFLIRKDIGSVGRNNDLAWNTKDYNFDNNSILNLLIYFSKNYQNFVWDDSEKHFINENLQSKKINNIADLFEDLYNENDTIALNSFIKLSQSNSKRVGELATERIKTFLIEQIM